MNRRSKTRTHYICLVMLTIKDLYDKLRGTEDGARRRERELVATNEHIAEVR